MQGLQVLCIGLNVVYTVSKAMVYSKPQFTLDYTELNLAEFGVFALFVFNQLNVPHIPSVLAASALPSAVQNQLQTLAVVLMAALVLVLGFFVNRDQYMYEGEVFLYLEKMLFVPCAFSALQIRMWTLVEVVTAWRYGLNVRVAKEKYPYRVKIVQICLPILAASPCIILPLTQDSTHELMLDVLSLPQEFTLVISLILLVVPCCYDWTVQGFSRNVRLERAPDWWRYAAYAGGISSLLASLYSFTQAKNSTLFASLGLDCGLLVVMVVWEALGRKL